MPDSPRHRPTDQGGEAPPAQGETVRSRGQKGKPSLPHDRDESAGSEEREQASQVEIGEQAHDDIERGLVDTGRAPVTNEVYKERLKGEAPAEGFGEEGERRAERAGAGGDPSKAPKPTGRR